MHSNQHYPDQHKAWRPDYPPVWCARGFNFAADFRFQPESANIIEANLKAFNTTLNIIDKAMTA